MPSHKMELYKTRLQRVEAILKSSLDSSEKLVLLAINARLMDHKGYCWPSQTKLAADASMSVRGLRRVLGRLRKRGFLTVRGQSAIDTLQYEIEWCKFPFLVKPTTGGGSPLKREAAFDPLTPRPAPPDSETGVPLTQSPTNRKKVNRKKRTSHTAGPKARLSASLAATPPETHKESPTAIAGKRTPTNEPEQFQAFLRRWAEVLPKSPLSPADITAWVEEWDSEEELRGSYPLILQIVELDDFYSGRKLGRDGKRFIMSPQYLLKETAGDKRWKLVLFGMIGSTGQTIAQFNLLNECELSPDMLWDGRSQLLHISRDLGVSLVACPESAKRKALYLASGVLEDQISAATLARFEKMLTTETGG